MPIFQYSTIPTTFLLFAVLTFSGCATLSHEAPGRLLPTGKPVIYLTGHDEFIPTGKRYSCIDTGLSLTVMARAQRFPFDFTMYRQSDISCEQVLKELTGSVEV